VAKPARIDSAVNIKQIAAGLSQVLALARNGTVWAWCDNSQGQLGVGYADRNGALTASPVHPGGLTGITQVNAADLSSGAIRSDQMLTAWGMNVGDRLGLGTGGDYAPTPTIKNDLFGVSTAVVGSTAFAVATSVTVVPRVIVPSVLGGGNAPQILHDAGLVEGNIATTPDDRYCARLGQIKNQSPAAGTLVPFGSRVDVTIYVRPAQPCL
jgi:alpha-tubulin suppressor-like RCC1 family protein